MIYITGDTHGEFGRFKKFCKEVQPTTDDVMIILGDAAFNYAGNKHDEERKAYVNGLGMTVFSIHGNHEMRPADVPGYKTKEFCGGTVWYEDRYHNLLFAKDGEIYRFVDYDCIVIGGAYSVDKFWRLMSGRKWFVNEQPSQEIKEYVFAQDNGKPMHPDSVTDWLNKFGNRHNLPHINPHAFRHTMASVLLFNKADSVSVSKRLGHAQVSTTENIYAHIIEEADQSNADILEDVFLKKA